LDFLWYKNSDRTAAEREYAAEATRRRRRILQSRILFYAQRCRDKNIVTLLLLDLTKKDQSIIIALQDTPEGYLRGDGQLG